MNDGTRCICLRCVGTGFDRDVYVGTPLSVQVVAPKLEERKLCEVMSAIDEALRADTKVSSKL